jgi:hypothetical protein
MLLLILCMCMSHLFPDGNLSDVLSLNNALSARGYIVLNEMGRRS